MLATAVFLAGCKKKPAEPPSTEHHQHEDIPNEPPVVTAVNTVEPAKTDAKPKPTTRVSLNDVIQSARMWGPAYTSWYGRHAPDFTLTDIAGKKHKLSDYRGKNVMITLWATWCQPCIIELPHLIALRNTVSEDELAVLAISYITLMPRETTEMVKKFVKENERINYPVFSTDPRAMPAPFGTVNSIPCSFFIDPEGKIKLATQGVLTLGYMKAILRAE